jgi:4-carboxymuconolactone decarboxylase
MSDSRYQSGLHIRRKVLGDDYVDRKLADPTSLDADFQRFVTEVAWGSVWSRPELDLRTRSLITISILAALGRDEELALHLRASRNTGVDPNEIIEALLHVAVYAGIPAANTAFQIARAELLPADNGPHPDRDQDPEPDPPEDTRRKRR